VHLLGRDEQNFIMRQSVGSNLQQIVAFSQNEHFFSPFFCSFAQKLIQMFVNDELQCCAKKLFASKWKTNLLFDAK
jgi:hypothetical protein